jgi:hypothetical protein
LSYFEHEALLSIAERTVTFDKLDQARAVIGEKVARTTASACASFTPGSSQVEAQ